MTYDKVRPLPGVSQAIPGGPHLRKAPFKQNDLIIIPVGSTECHGAAQPLGEDTFLVIRMAE